jgi:hypothetical protein
MSAPAPVRPPLRVAVTGVGLAVRVLPDWHDRLRYRAEFLAELHDLPPAEQLRYTAGVLSQTFALRAALGSAPSRVEEVAMSVSTPTRVPFFRCRLFRWHRWVTCRTEDGDRYVACRECGRLLHDGVTSGPNGLGFNTARTF